MILCSQLLYEVACSPNRGTFIKNQIIYQGITKIFSKRFLSHISDTFMLLFDKIRDYAN